MLRGMKPKKDLGDSHPIQDVSSSTIKYTKNISVEVRTISIGIFKITFNNTSSTPVLIDSQGELEPVQTFRLLFCFSLDMF